ncbi:MAG TPA: bifunctional riboflavin kinase/FAD synthetase [Candidatus Angelobacter sp.]|nr:bifunctional riboflavin kinase/FAD synthetase [Candidatus Angelobacter sp.]
MRIFRSIEEIPADFGPTITTVGNFDGVHCGHQQVIGELVRRARETGSKAVAVTFDPHPLRILRPDAAPRLITPGPVKERLLGNTGLDALVVVPFTRDFSMTTAEEFVRQILCNTLHAREVHEGENFHFGHKAQGTPQRLQEMGRELGFDVKVYPVMMLRGSRVSSSEIRNLLGVGKVSRARRLLGRFFSITAAPGRGRGLGHKYTVPTINLSRYDELVPGNGVYVTRTRVGDETFDSVTNVGNRPTFGEDSFAIETHLLNFHPLEVTAQTDVEIFFEHWRRPEIKFPSVDALREQIGKDVRRARRFFHLMGKVKPTTETRGH